MTAETPTQKLVAKAQAADRAAWEEITQRFNDRLTHHVRLRLGKKLRSKIEVEDVVQEVLCNALEAIIELYELTRT